MSNRRSLPPEQIGTLDTQARAASTQSAGTPGAVVGVRTDGGTWFGTFGTADPDTGAPMATDTRLRIGSVTKTFTATLVLQMVESGELSLSHPIARYVPGVPRGDDITLGLLATMRSGLANYTSVPEFAAQIMADPRAPHTIDEVITAGLSNSPVFAPDGQFDYCNTNYILLGRVVEQVAGSDFGAVVSRRILEPLGWADTWWPGDSARLPAPHARGFTLLIPSDRPGVPTDATGFNPSWAGAAGALVSTAEDLLDYGHALVTGEGLLDAGTQALRLDSFGPAPSLGPGVSYGIGLMQIDGWIGHSGDIPGYRAACYHHPEISTTVVVLTASDIVAGRCPEKAAAVTIATDDVCMSPTARIFDAVSKALGRPSATPTAAA